jgi:chromosome segregation ATPase
VRVAVEQEKSACTAKIEEVTAEFGKKEKEYTTALEKFTFHLQSLTSKNKDLEASVEEYKTKADDLTSLLEEAALKEEVLTEEIEAARKTALEEAKSVFERQLGDKQKEIDDLKSAVAAARDSSKSMAELTESASKLAAARQELEAVRTAHEEAVAALKEAHKKETAHLESETSALKQKVGTLSEELESAQAEVATLNESASASNSGAQQLASETSELKKQIAGLSQQLEASQAEAAALKESASASNAGAQQLESETSELKNQIHNLSQQLEAAKTEVASLKESASASDAGTQQLQSEASDLKKQVAALAQQLEAAHAEVTALKESASASDAGSQNASQEIGGLKAEIATLNSRVATATKASEESQGELRKLQALLVASEETAAAAASTHDSVLASLKSQLVETEEKYAALSQSSASETKELQDLLAAAEKKSAALTASHADSVSSLEKRVLDLTNELKAATSGAGDAEKQLRDELNEKRSRLDALEAELSQLNADRQAALDDAEAAKSELAIQKELLEDVELKLQDAQTRLSEAELSQEEELDKVQKELNAAHKKVAELQKSIQVLEEKALQTPAVVSAPSSDGDIVALRAELEKVKETYEDQLATLNDQLEMATVDKELAEGQFEDSQREIVSLKQQVSQLQVAVERIPSPAEAPAPVPTPFIGAPASDADVEALAQQNVQLTEALMQLKNFAESSQAELQRLQGDVLPNLEIAKATLEEKVLDYEDRLEALKASVEDASSLQEKFQDIFEQKMDLEEELRSVKETMSDLQALRDLADETEENHQALEKRLQSELYSKQVEVLDKEGVISNMNLVLEERSQTIERLERFLNELQLIRQRDAEAAASQTGTDSQQEEQSRESEELAVLLRQQASREAVKALQDSLHDLDMQQAILQNRLFRLFVPEGAIKSDQEASSLLLLMKRIAFKANLSALNLHRQFSMDRFERNLDQQDEFNRFVWSLEQLVFRFEFNASQIIDALRDCDEDTYSKLAKLLYEVAPYEKKIDHVLSLIQTENIRLNQPPLDDLNITLERFDFLCDKFVPKSLVSPSRIVSSSIRSLMFDSRSILYMVKQFIGPTSAASAFGVSDDRFKMLQELSRKLIRLLVSGTSQNAVDYVLRDVQQLPSDVMESIMSSSKLVAMILSAVTTASQQFAKISAEDPSKVSNPSLVGNLFEDLIRDALSKNETVVETFSASSKLVESRASHVVASPRDAMCVLDKYYDVVFKLLAAFEEELSRGVHDAVATEISGSTPSTPIKCAY